MGETTARLGLPLLVPGQGQKDITHNEAILALDILVGGAVASRSFAAPPAARRWGDCWLVPQSPADEWLEREGLVACWTMGGWRFLAVPDGYRLWVSDEQVELRKAGVGWEPVLPLNGPSAGVVMPEGGGTVDVEARRALGDLLERLIGLGLISA
jgi:hypothetical protein